MKTILNKQMIVPAILIFSGLLFFTIGSGLTYKQRTAESQGIETQGVVVDMQENYNSDGSTYTPVVQFKTISGQSVEFVGSYSSSPPAYEIGQSVTVVYPADGLEKAVIKGDGQILHIIFMAVGGIDALVGMILFSKALRAAIIAAPEE